jgi:hypothetical protein
VFEYCSSRHIDPAYEHAGTVDCGILHIERGTLLLYSIVNEHGQWMQLQVFPPMQFDHFVSINKIKGKTVKEIFQRARKVKGMKVKLKCVIAESDDLLKLVRQDAAQLTPADLASLETIIAEVF